MLTAQKRPALITTATTAVLALGGLGLCTAAPASAEPSPDSVGSVQHRLQGLYHRAEQASEQMNETRGLLDASRGRLDQINAVVAEKEKAAGDMQRQVESFGVAQSQMQGLSSSSSALLSQTATSYSGVTTSSTYAAQTGRMMRTYRAELHDLQEERADQTSLVHQLALTQQTLRTQKRALGARVSDAKALLGRLKDQQRRELAERTVVIDGESSVAASGAAAEAVRYAMDQVGKSYVYGAAGPSSFDCSGLTMRAWGAAGVSLPHSSSAQQGSGTRVSESELQPGDLVFYYSPVSHVGMYIGNGLIVNAENPSVGVKVTGVDSMPYAGAVRPG